MGIDDFFKKIFNQQPPPKEYITRTNILDLTKRLGVPYQKLKFFQPAYREFTIPKRNGGKRAITATEGHTRYCTSWSCDAYYSG